jgi:alpha-1,2-glucosyltransferase
MYFLAFVLAIQIPLLYIPKLIPIFDFYFGNGKKIFFTSLGVLGLVFLIERYSPVHLYLISDNRHYTFYLWKYVYERFPQAKFWLIPVYLFSFGQMCIELGKF